MKAGKDLNGDPFTKANPFPAADRIEFVLCDTQSTQYAYGLIRTDNLRVGVADNPFRAPQMVKVRMPDDDPIALVHVLGLQARPGRSLHPINVGIQE